MAKGTLVFEFESPLDLENQMRAYLRMPPLKEVGLGEVNAPLPVNAQVEAARRGAEAIEFNALAMAGKTLIAEEVRTANQETPEAAPKPEEPPQEMPKTVPDGAAGPDITLETLATVPYPELLHFCERNPEVGVDVSKSQPSFFRKLVEMRVKAYLETK